MLRSSKMPPKAHKSSKDAVLRKSHMLKKSHRSGSPMRIPNSSRSSLNMKHISPGQRVHPMEKRKSSHSPRMRSIAMSPHRSLPRRKPESPVTMERYHHSSYPNRVATILHRQDYQKFSLYQISPLFIQMLPEKAS